MPLVILSDTHGLHRTIPAEPDGDVLIHAGDFMRRGDLEELPACFAWFREFPHPAKLVSAGNHDWAFERQSPAAEALIPSDVTYLRDSGRTIDGVNFWGSPWQPWFNDWAFNLQRGQEIAEKGALIPDDVDVLVTHGPPHGVLDAVDGPPARHVGCEALLDRIATLPNLRVHAFGHVHEDYGTLEEGGRRFVNASICNRLYKPVNAPRVVDV